MAEIRLFGPTDAARLTTIFREAVLRTGLRAYGAAQVQAWVTRAPSPARFEALADADGSLLVAVDTSDQPVGFAHLEAGGRLAFLFVSPAVGRRGIGRQLIEAVLANASERGVREVTVEASEIAKPLFARMGFELIERRDLTVAGHPIHHYAMVKRLDEGA